MSLPLSRDLKGVAAGFAALVIVAGPARAMTGFSGPFDPGNWTQVTEGDSVIDTSGAPASISLTSANNGVAAPGIEQNADFTITAPQAAQVLFAWAYETSDPDGPEFDPFGYLLNGAFVQLTDDGGPPQQSGSTSFPVMAGDVFGFRQNSEDSRFGPATTVVRDFHFRASAVPAPLPVLGAAAAFGCSRRIRRRLRLRSAPAGSGLNH